MNKYAIEFIGTFFLVLVVAMTANPLAIGLVLAAMVYMGGYISGAHYNPAVTLAVRMRGLITDYEMLGYWLMQLAAALLASAIAYLVRGQMFIVQPGANTSYPVALLVEIIFTFALVSVVLHTAFSTRVAKNDYYGLAIGLTLVACAFAAGPFSGGALNPAVGIGTNLADISNLGPHLYNIALYLIGPLAGGALAALAFGFTAVI